MSHQGRGEAGSSNPFNPGTHDTSDFAKDARTAEIFFLSVFLLENFSHMNLGFSLLASLVGLIIRKRLLFYHSLLSGLHFQGA